MKKTKASKSTPAVKNRTTGTASDTTLLFRTLFDQSPDGILIIDTDGKIIDFNQAACCQFGYSRLEFSKLHLSDIDLLCAPEESLKAGMDKVSRNGSDTFEFRHRTKSGEMRDVRVLIQELELSECSCFHTLWRDVTGQNRAERSLQESFKRLEEEREKWQAIIVAIGEGVTIRDTNYRIMYQNHVMTERLGDHVGEFCYTAYHGLDRVCEGCPVESAFKDGKVHRAERTRTTDAGALYFENLASPIRDSTGKVIGCIELVRNITEHKRSNEALKETNAKLHALINAIPDAVFFKDVQGQYLTVNKAFEENTGLKKEMVIGKSDEDLMPHDIAENCRKSDEALMKDGAPMHLEDTIIARDGEKQYFESVKTPIYDSQGALLGLVGVSRDVTGRRKIVEALKEREEQYRALFDGSPDAIVLADPETGKVLDANPEAVRLLARKREELVGLHQSQLHPPDRETSSRRIFEERIAELKRDGETHPTEISVLRPDGSLVPVEILARIVVIRGEKVLQGLFRDITERKLAEAALRESDERFRGAFEYASIGMSITALDGRWLKVNRSLCDIVGYSSRELLSKTYREMTHPDDLENSLADGKRLLTGEIPYLHTEKRYLHKRGHVVWVILSVSLVRDSRGLPLYFVSQIEDISARKSAEEALRKSEAFAKNILETVDEGFIIIDGEYKILSANKAYLSQVKMSLDSILGKHCYEVSHKLSKPCYEVNEDCAVRRTFATGEPGTTVHRHSSQNGDPVIVEIKSYPIRDEGGSVVSVIEVVNNITERRKLEEQLHHAQKMEAVGHLAGGIAHDFNNILTAIVGYGSLMKMQMAPNDPLAHNLQQILDSSDRAANLTRGLLAFSRKQVINPKPIDLNKIVGNIEKLLRRLISEYVDMKVILANGELIVMADSGQIEQVLMNLVANAKDAMPEKGGLAISTETVELDRHFVQVHGHGKTGIYALISVKDTGIGMDKKTQEKIFEPFFTTKEVGRGTGLGLSIVYGIVNQHNGFITCDSEPGKGTEFRIYLPIIRQEVMEARTFEYLPVAGGAETILVAEDDATVRSLVKEILELGGYAVIEAVDGDDAFKKFQEHENRIQLLLFDIMMPKKNGKIVFEEIQKVRPDIKIIFSSGYTADILHKQGVLPRDLNYVSKPVEPLVLLKKVRETLDAR